MAEHLETLVLQGDGGVDTAGLMVRAHRDLPHPPGRGVSDGWTALADDVWERLVLSPATELALVWRDSDQLLRARLDDFLDAVDALHRLGRQLNAPSNRDTPRKTLYLFWSAAGRATPRSRGGRLAFDSTGQLVLPTARITYRVLQRRGAEHGGARRDCVMRGDIRAGAGRGRA